MADLKPCPFCGGKAQLDHNQGGILTRSYVRCNSCGCKTWEFTISTEESSDMEAIEAWNRRVGDGRLN